MCEKSLYFYIDDITYDDDAMKKHWRPVMLGPLSALFEKLSKLESWTKDALQNCINDICVEFDMNMGKVAQPLRVSITGGTVSPSIDITLALLGPEKALSRLQKTLQSIQKRSEQA